MDVVDAYLAKLEHPRSAQIRQLCRLIEEQMPGLGTEIKWNAPSYTSGATNIATLRLLPAPNFQVILHAGSGKIASPPDLRFDIHGFAFTWPDKTRCQVFVEPDSALDQLVALIRTWEKLLDDNGLLA